MKNDPVVQEVRAARERLLAEHGGDLEKYVRFLQQRQKEDPWPIAREKARTAPITRRKRARGNVMARRVISSDATIKMRGMAALAKALGLANAGRFLSMCRSDGVDYVKVSRRLYQGQGLDEIYARAAKNWRG